MFSCRCNPGWVCFFIPSPIAVKDKTNRGRYCTANRLLSKRTRGLCCQTSGAQMSAHIFEDSNHLFMHFHVRVLSPYWATHWFWVLLMLPAPPWRAEQIFRLLINKRAEPLPPTGVDYGLADLLKLPRWQSPWWVGVITSPVISWLEQQRDLSSASSAIGRREIDGFICERSDGTTRADIHSELIRGATLQASRHDAAAAFPCAAAREGAGMRLLSCPVHKTIYHQRSYRYTHTHSITSGVNWLWA